MCVLKIPFKSLYFVLSRGKSGRDSNFNRQVKKLVQKA